MAELTRQEITQNGLNVSFSSAEASGDSYVADDRTFLIVKNDDASSHTATIQVQRATFDIPGYGEVTFEDLAVAVPAGEERWIKAPQAPYADGNGKVQVTYDAITSVTVAAVRMPAG